MKIVVTLTVDVDADAWDEIYGTDRSETRQNVKDYVYNAVQQSAGIQDTEASVNVR